MSVPPYVVAAFTTVIAGYTSDRIKQRGFITIGMASLGGLGFLLLLVSTNTQVQYAGLFLAAAGVYPLIPLIVSWGSNNIGGSLKKGVGTAIIVSLGNAGGCISSFLYPKEDKPRYIKGHAVCLAYCGIVVVTSLIMMTYFKIENTRKAKRNAARGHAWTPEEMEEFKEHGENTDWFVYTL